jgi:hypothetical protein
VVILNEVKDPCICLCLFFLVLREYHEAPKIVENFLQNFNVSKSVHPLPIFAKRTTTS